MRKEQYAADELGYYNRHYYEQTGEKARPLVFENGGVYYDEPGRAATRASRRNITARRHAHHIHRNTADIIPYSGVREYAAAAQVLRPRVEVYVSPAISDALPTETSPAAPAEWELLPDEH